MAPRAGQIARASQVGGDIGCLLRRSANQSVNTAVFTGIQWDTEDQDTGGFITTTSATITVPTGKAGIYGITFNAVASGAAGTLFTAIVPTSTITGMPVDLLATHDISIADRGSMSLELPLNAGDSFEAQVRHTTGAAVNFTAWLICVRLFAFPWA